MEGGAPSELKHVSGLDSQTFLLINSPFLTLLSLTGYQVFQTRSPFSIFPVPADLQSGGIFFRVFSLFSIVLSKSFVFLQRVYARLVKQTSVQAEPGGGDKGVQYFDTVNTVSHKLTASYLSPIVPNALFCLCFYPPQSSFI